MKLLKLFAATFLVAGLMFAQGGGGGRGDRLKQMATQLNLTEDQKTKIKPILQEEAGKMKAVRDDTSLTREDRMQKMQSIMADSKSKIDPLLTDEQKQKWDTMKSQARQAHRRQQ